MFWRWGFSPLTVSAPATIVNGVVSLSSPVEVETRFEAEQDEIGAEHVPWGGHRVKAFAELYAALDATTKTNEKVEVLSAYFSRVPPRDAAWAIHFLIGRRPKRLIESRKIWQWATAEAAIPEWLFGECYDAVGDVAETIALLLPAPAASSDKPLHYWVEERLLPMREWDEAAQRDSLLWAWREMDDAQRFVWNKLITGEFRVGVSQLLATRALAGMSGVDASVISHRLMGDWQPSADFVRQVLSKDTGDADISRPYPFCLAHPLEGAIQDLGPIEQWQVEWKWDGIRSQLIRRQGHTFLWSRGEELITDRFPEIQALGALLGEGTVIDGEVLSWKDGAPQPFAQLQRRIGRKVLGSKILKDVPAVLLAFDLLEMDAADVREQPIEWRRARLAEIVQRMASPSLILSPKIEADSWEQLAKIREEARSRGVEGCMLKRHGSPYRVGRRRGDWWKWKIDPYSVDAVLIYAQRGSGRRASLYTDYTFGIWDGDKLVPFAKAYSGLTDEEIRQVDAFVRRNTVERFGPVRVVKPELVFELAFEGIQRSTRHKSGIAVRFPRMARWRTDKKPEDADTLETIRALL
jgi:DNA ligase-1